MNCDNQSPYKATVEQQKQLQVSLRIPAIECDISVPRFSCMTLKVYYLMTEQSVVFLPVGGCINGPSGPRQ